MALPPPPTLGATCAVCGKREAGLSGMCMACQSSVVPRGTYFPGGMIPATPCPQCGAINATKNAVCPTCIRLAALSVLKAATGGTTAVVSEPLPKDDARRVDLIGWRVWRITGTGYLRSLTAEAIWLPGETMVAHTEIGDAVASASGVHIFDSRAAAMREIERYLDHVGLSNGYALGTVQLWGDVVEHERGYRAERAVIRSIDEVVLANKAPWDSEPVKALAFLRARYGVGAYIIEETGNADGDEA